MRRNRLIAVSVRYEPCVLSPVTMAHDKVDRAWLAVGWMKEDANELVPTVAMGATRFGASGCWLRR